MTQEELKRYADPRRYNLILSLGDGRLQGWFVPYGRHDTAPVCGVFVNWTPQPDVLLRHIENAVYDNPVLLEDYECCLLIDTPRLLLFPPQAPVSLIESAMNRFYAAEATDVFVRRMGDAQVAFTLCAGLRSFLGRTFAGVEPMLRIEPLARRFGADRSAPGRVRVYADIDAPYLHLLAYSGSRLLHASTHRATTTDDAAYFILSLWQQLDLGTDRGELNISGSADVRKSLMPMLRRHLNYVNLSLLPRVEDAEKVPTPVLLAFGGED